MPWRPWLSVLALSGAAFAYVSWLEAPSYRHQPDDAVARQYEAEVLAATDQGLEPVLEGSTTDADRSVRVSVTLAAGDCVAVVAASAGDQPPRVLFQAWSLRLESSDLDVVHLAGCVDEASVGTLSVTRTSWHVPSEVRYTLLQGHVRDPRSYERLALGAEQEARLDAAADVDAVETRLDAQTPDAARLGPLGTATPEGAVMVTTTRASWAALRALSGRHDAVPAVAAGAASDPFASSDDVSIPPRVFVPTGQARVVAVLDAAALGACCVALTFARLDAPETAEPLTAWSVPDLSTHVVEASDAAIAVDRICPARGLFVYTLPEDSSARDVVVVASRVDASPESGATTAPEPSHFGDATVGADPSSGLVVLPVALVASSSASCAADDEDACFALAVLAQEGIEGAGSVHDALGPRCASAGGLACDVLAGMAGDPVESMELERRACATGVADACLRRGLRLLIGARDLVGARRALQYGCTHGSHECCTARETMEDYALATVDPEVPDEP